MRLLQAHIRGFGRLVERSFVFCPDVQVIVGANEAGKSTLQQFLLAMLFGMKREDRKRRDYLPQYELYRPWGGEPYEGRLVYALSDGDRFEVQRVFERERESVQVLDAVTARDLTEEFPMDSRKERTLMQSQLELTRQLFEATTSLGQLSVKPTNAGVGALRERVQGLLDSGDENVSASAARGALLRLRDALGTERTPTRGIGLLMREKQLLQAELEEAQSRHGEVLELYERRRAATHAHARAEHAWRRRRALERSRERDELDRRMHAAESLEQRLDIARQRLATYDDVENVDVAAYAPARERAAGIAALEGQVRAQAARLDVLGHRDAELAPVEERLREQLGGMDRGRSQSLQVDASRLREEIGRVREARRRHAQEQRENREVVERLRTHHDRDWTRDDFMVQLVRQQDALDGISVEPVQERLAQHEHTYRRLKRRLLIGVVSGVVGVGALTIVGLFWAPGLPPIARVGTPMAAALLGLLFLPGGLRQMLAERDQTRALRAQATRIMGHRREAQHWLREVLRSNDCDDVEQLHARRREYESLRAQAERSAALSGTRELQEHEKELERLAAELHDVVGRCDLGALRGLLNAPSEAARMLLPYAEAAAADDWYEEDSPELQRLLEDLSVLPELRRCFDWLERVREERQRQQEQIEVQTAEFDRQDEELQGAKAGLREVLERNGAKTLDEFATRVERSRERERVLAEYVPLQSEQAGVLGAETLEVLRGRLADLASETHAVAGASPDSSTQAALDFAVHAHEQANDASEREEVLASATLEDLRHEVERLAAVRAQLEERLVAREREGRSPAEVALHLTEIEGKLAEAHERDQGLVLAAETIQSVAVALHRQVAPQMNARVGEIFQQLSRGEHSEVQLDEDLTPRVRMDGGQVFGAESLSGGAADQLYFAMRVTAGEQLARSGERLPLLLDDPFVQYDPDRLQAALDLVTELALQHQVLFFTCEESQGLALVESVRARGIECDLTHL